MKGKTRKEIKYKHINTSTQSFVSRPISDTLYGDEVEFKQFLLFNKISNTIWTSFPSTSNPRVAPTSSCSTLRVLRLHTEHPYLAPNFSRCICISCVICPGSDKPWSNEKRTPKAFPTPESIFFSLYPAKRAENLRESTESWYRASNVSVTEPFL